MRQGDDRGSLVRVNFTDSVVGHPGLKRYARHGKTGSEFLPGIADDHLKLQHGSDLRERACSLVRADNEQSPVRPIDKVALLVAERRRLACVRLAQDGDPGRELETAPDQLLCGGGLDDTVEPARQRQRLDDQFECATARQPESRGFLL